jgi:hypothetical protein
MSARRDWSGQATLGCSAGEPDEGRAPGKTGLPTCPSPCIKRVSLGHGTAGALIKMGNALLPGLACGDVRVPDEVP